MDPANSTPNMSTDPVDQGAFPVGSAQFPPQMPASDTPTPQPMTTFGGDDNGGSPPMVSVDSGSGSGKSLPAKKILASFAVLLMLFC